jgi:beta-N-acetylhexosaminidase
MASRAVSADPKLAIAYVREFLRGLREAGVLGCGKHFPGLGEGNLDSHHDLPVIEKSWKRMWEEDLVPYRVLRRDYPFIMISHAAYPAVTRERTPASLSQKWIREVLRKKIGYRGLILSDDLEMGGVLSAGPVDQAAIEHIRAGGDVCLICHKQEYIVTAYEAILREAERDRKFRSRAAESVQRVLAFKKRSREVRRSSSPPKAATIDRLRRAIWEFSEQVRLENLNQEQA